MPLSGRSSLTTLTSILVLTLGATAFAGQYFASARRTVRWRRRGHLRRILEVAGLTLTAAGITVLVIVSVCSVFDLAFPGLLLNAPTAAVLSALVLGGGLHLLLGLAEGMTTSRLAGLLGVFLAGGVFAGMLTADDPRWWESNFSAPGISTAASSWTFNVTVILAGLVLTTLADSRGCPPAR